MQTYIISVMAGNQVGIVAAVSKAIDELGGNLVELSQTVMRGFFTILLAAEFPADRQPEEIARHVRQVGDRFGLQISILKDTGEDQAGLSRAETERFLLTVTGRDRPGIVRQIAARLAEKQIDIVDLYAASPDDHFQMILELDVPAGVDTRALAQQLEQEGRAIGLSAHLVHENIFVATNEPRPVRIGRPPGATRQPAW
jgi:glycine cleavage system transcriptional repressor